MQIRQDHADKKIAQMVRPFSVFQASDGLWCLRDANGVIVTDESYVFRKSAKASAKRKNEVRH